MDIYNKNHYLLTLPWILEAMPGPTRAELAELPISTVRLANALGLAMLVCGYTDADWYRVVFIKQPNNFVLLFRCVAEPKVIARLVRS